MSTLRWPQAVSFFRRTDCDGRAATWAGVVVALGLLTPGCKEGATPPPARLSTLDLGNARRTYLLHVPPSYDASAAMPLVIALHGYSSYAFALQSYSRLSEKADEQGFLVVYPNGVTDSAGNQAWNAGASFATATGGADDVGFVAALIDHLSTTYAVDPARIFVTGHSNGAFMAYRLAAELSHRIAAIAPVSGQMISDFPPTPTERLSIVHFHAKGDPTVAFDGGTLQDGARLQPVESVLTSWAGRLGCATEPTVVASSDIATIKEWPCATPTEAVQLYITARGGHAWMTESGTGLSATDVIWAFFAAHPKENR